MNSENKELGISNGLQSADAIQQMRFVSEKQLKKNSVLFILWGWLAFYNYFVTGYLIHLHLFSHVTKNILQYLGAFLLIGVLVFTIYYLYKGRRNTYSYIAISLRYIWVGLIVSMVLVNIIQFNVLRTINFELQHPVFMVLVAFAVAVTGGVSRYHLLVFAGILYGILALAASYYDLSTQLLIDSFAWLVAFIIPGHIMHYQSRM